MMLLSGLGKKFALLLSFIVVLSLLSVELSVAPVNMPSNPSVAPEVVSVVVNHNPIWRPPIYTTNPYTGEVTETSPGMYLQNGTVDVTIKNRPFTPYVDKNGNYINVCYTFFMRQNGPFDDWSEYISSVHGPWYAVYQQSDSEYTVITFIYNGTSGPAPFFSVVSSGARRSFYVQAVTGYFYRDENIGAGYFNSVYEGEGSLWSQFTIDLFGN